MKRDMRIAYESGQFRLYLNGEVLDYTDAEQWPGDKKELWEKTIKLVKAADEKEEREGRKQELGYIEDYLQGRSREEIVKETKDNMWETKNEGEVPLPFWTVWDLVQYCANCDFDSCTPDNDCEVVKATMACGTPWKWDMESCLLTREDYQICVAMGAKCVTVNDMEKGVVTLWASMPEKEYGVYNGRKCENGEREKPLAVIPTDKHFQALRHAGIIQGAMMVYLPKRLYDEWNKRQEEDF